MQCQGGLNRVTRQTSVRCSATPTASRTITPSSASPGTTGPPPVNPLLMAAVSALFKWPPLFNMAKSKARETIRQRAISIGLDWDGSMAELAAQDWTGLMKQVTKPGITYPSYYTQPFHAYTEGNMCWEAALEVTNAAKSVHALVMDPQGKELDAEGDVKMRRSFNQRTRENMLDLEVNPDAVRDVVDLGCATGLSSVALMEAFPSCQVTGVDLSPHFLTVGRYQQQKREVASGRPEPLRLVHGNAEQTELPSASCDLVSVCLVCHELPQAASQSVFREAFRLLRPGGCLAVMEMDPTLPAWQRSMTNPFAFAGFKSTEPWLEEYIGLDMHGAMREAGFQAVVQQECTSRHKTVVALKA